MTAANINFYDNIVTSCSKFCVTVMTVFRTFDINEYTHTLLDGLCHFPWTMLNSFTDTFNEGHAE